MPGFGDSPESQIKGWASQQEDNKVRDFQVVFHPQKQLPQTTSPVPDGQEETQEHNTKEE